MVAQEDKEADAPQIAAAIAAGAHPQSAKEDKKAHKEVNDALAKQDDSWCQQVPVTLPVACAAADLPACRWSLAPCLVSAPASHVYYRSWSGCMVLR